MNKVEHLLTILGEEAVDIAHRASKAKRFGLEEIEPGCALTNAQRIKQEMVDMEVAFDLLHEEVCGVEWWPDPADRDWYFKARDAKRAKILKFLDYSKSVGTLT
jgi:hypothetical protein